MLDESDAENFEGQRLQEISGMKNGLGPDDMVRLEKIEHSTQKTMVTYHHVIGLEMNSPTDFVSYCEQISESNKSKYKVIRGTINCINSFRQTDTFINPSEPPDCDWNELRMSCILRYYRARFPAVTCVFGGEPIFTKCLNLVPLASTVTRNDLEFVVKNHPLSNEFFEALGRLMIVSLETKDLVRFICDFWHKISHVLPIILSLLSPNHKILNAIYIQIENHLVSFPDDVTMACILINHYISSGRVSECGKLIPLLLSVVWDVPLAGIALARVCIAEQKYADAFEYLNAVAYSVGWPVKISEDDMSMTEKRLLRTPLTGPYSDYYDVIAELYSAVGSEKVQKMVQEFDESRDISDNTQFVTRPSHQFCVEEFEGSEKFLYDPGITEDAAICGKRQTPFARPFQDMIKAVVGSITKHERLCVRRTAIANDATGNLVTAIKQKDAKMIKQIFDYAKKSCTITFVDFVLVYKAASMGLFNVDDIIHTHSPSSITPTQRSCLLFLSSFVSKICHLPVNE